MWNFLFYSMFFHQREPVACDHKLLQKPVQETHLRSTQKKVDLTNKIEDILRRQFSTWPFLLFTFLFKGNIISRNWDLQEWEEYPFRCRILPLAERCHSRRPVTSLQPWSSGWSTISKVGWKDAWREGTRLQHSKGLISGVSNTEVAILNTLTVAFFPPSKLAFRWVTI